MTMMYSGKVVPTKQKEGGGSECLAHSHDLFKKGRAYQAEERWRQQMSCA